jgi:hypothetical protein
MSAPINDEANLDIELQYINHSSDEESGLPTVYVSNWLIAFTNESTTCSTEEVVEAEIPKKQGKGKGKAPKKRYLLHTISVF